MQVRLRFYTGAHGVNDDAVSRIITKAISLESVIENVSRIVFISHGLGNDGWLERQYGDDGVKKLRKGAKLPGSRVNARFDSLKTYAPVNNEILITLGLGSDEILTLDDNYDTSAIISLPWMEDDVVKWSKITNAVNIDDNTNAISYDLPSCIVRKALEDLTDSINMTTGLSHSSDDNKAKTYLRALNHYDYTLDELQIEAYLINQLNWKKRHTDKLLEIVARLNTGRSFHGGDKTGYKNHIKIWKNECGE
jgi:hypothetical protein